MLTFVMRGSPSEGRRAAPVPVKSEEKAKEKEKAVDPRTPAERAYDAEMQARVRPPRPLTPGPLLPCPRPPASCLLPSSLACGPADGDGGGASCFRI